MKDSHAVTNRSDDSASLAKNRKVSKKVSKEKCLNERKYDQI